MVELVGGGSDINRATPSSFSVSVLLLASVERFGVSRMRDFFGCIENRRSFFARQNPPLCCVLLKLTISFEPLMGF